MRLSHAQALLDTSFLGMKEGAARMYEPEDLRFDKRLSAVWLEYRWYVHERGLAEVFVKWKRVEKEACAQEEVSVLRIHLLGHSAMLTERAQRVLEVGLPSPGRLLDLFGSDGVKRECSAAGATGITLEHWPHPAPQPLLPEETFQALSAVLVDPGASFEERHEAVDRLCRERSPRVVHTLLAALEVGPSLSALRRLSEWGEPGALPHLERALAAVAPDNPADLWALTALQRRLQAWKATTLAGEPAM
ncbi:hypothetical protein [Vitiosangium sp. GDMCC 1.1324]|uniref:hypothetical protein n=1 Tax=Vitiosangium sp. (strain GDMCC 1.1324) TaxID=2138576 RepID=UPI000D379945|nr:hypothetical protein [Vitiosangium sp. GDMCC 1.1324]PTL84408.1 hypothetical protein DAT35_04760 [Vitiosangium sp. GDMCC 1.1324]